MREITLAQTIKTIDKLLNAFKNIRPKNTILIIIITIKINYNFISEEPMEYVNSSFDDKFVISDI